MLRPSQPWRSPLQARDLRDETPWAALPPSCLPCSLPSLPPCVTAHHAPSLPRPRDRLVASGVGGLTRPSLGSRSGNANSNAPERAQVQSDLASRRRNQAPSGDPFARDCLKGQQFVPTGSTTHSLKTTAFPRLQKRRGSGPPHYPHLGRRRPFQ